MRIEEGKYYRTRDGRKVGPVRPATNPDNGPFQADLSDGSNWCYDADGRLTNLRHEDMAEDIVAEWPEGPVVTETVRRIEPGVYGPLKVGAEISIPDCDRPDQPPPREIEAYLTKSCLDASDWRELARAAFEIAEYLDAQ